MMRQNNDELGAGQPKRNPSHSSLSIPPTLLYVDVEPLYKGGSFLYTRDGSFVQWSLHGHTVFVNTLLMKQYS